MRTYMFGWLAVALLGGAAALGQPPTSLPAPFPGQAPVQTIVQMPYQTPGQTLMMRTTASNLAPTASLLDAPCVGQDCTRPTCVPEHYLKEHKKTVFSSR